MDPVPEYEVEEIRGQMLVDGVKHYQVKWKGYASDEATWEPECNIDPVSIEEFKSQYMQQSVANRKPRAEKILSYRVDHDLGEEVVLVKWEGKHERHSTWEPVSSFRNSRLLREFDEQQIRRQRTRKKEKPKSAAEKSQPKKASRAKAEAVASSLFRARKSSRRLKAAGSPKPVPKKKTRAQRVLPSHDAGRESKKRKLSKQVQQEAPVNEDSTVTMMNDSDDSDSMVEWNAGESFEVEKILDVRVQPDGERQFLIKWKGWSTDWNQWQYEDNMGGCHDMIAAFMKERKKRRGSQRTPKRSSTKPSSTKRSSTKPSSAKRSSTENTGPSERDSSAYEFLAPAMSRDERTAARNLRRESSLSAASAAADAAAGATDDDGDLRVSDEDTAAAVTTVTTTTITSSAAASELSPAPPLPPQVPQQQELLARPPSPAASLPPAPAAAQPAAAPTQPQMLAAPQQPTTAAAASAIVRPPPSAEPPSLVAAQEAALAPDAVVDRADDGAESLLKRVAGGITGIKALARKISLEHDAV